jgi:hypothetical protein
VWVVTASHLYELFISEVRDAPCHALSGSADHCEGASERSTHHAPYQWPCALAYAYDEALGAENQALVRLQGRWREGGEEQEWGYDSDAEEKAEAIRKWVLKAKMRWSEVKWSEVKWSEVKRSGVKWCEVKWCEVKWSEVKWSEVKWSEVKWRRVKWSEVKW